MDSLDRLVKDGLRMRMSRLELRESEAIRQRRDGQPKDKDGDIGYKCLPTTQHAALPGHRAKTSSAGLRVKTAESGGGFGCFFSCHRILFFLLRHHLLQFLRLHLDLLLHFDFLVCLCELLLIRFLQL